MGEHIVNTKYLPRAWRININDFSEHKLVRCKGCIFYEEGWCEVWEAETLEDGFCYQGAEDEEDLREEAA